MNRGFFVHPMVLLKDMLDESGIGSEGGGNDAPNVKAIGMAVLSHGAPNDREGIAEEFNRIDQGFDAGNGGDIAGHGGGI